MHGLGRMFDGSAKEGRKLASDFFVVAETLQSCHPLADAWVDDPWIAAQSKGAHSRYVVIGI